MKKDWEILNRNTIFKKAMLSKNKRVRAYLPKNQ